MLISKKQLSESLSSEHGLTKIKSNEMVDFIFKKIAESLSSGEDISISGFGKFIVAERPARKGRNPLTGKNITIAASKRVKFKPSKNLKEMVNN